MLVDDLVNIVPWKLDTTTQFPNEFVNTGRKERLSISSMMGLNVDSLFWLAERFSPEMVRTFRLGLERTPLLCPKDSNRATWAAALNEGHTVILDQTEAFSRMLADFCARLGSAVGAFCSANLYVTPSDSQAFDMHKDGHHSFVIQLLGEKVWTVSRGNQAGALDQAVLKTGDIYFLSGNTSHMARTARKPSIHLTIGLHEPRVLDVFELICAESSRNDPATEGLQPLRVPATVERLRQISVELCDSNIPSKLALLVQMENAKRRCDTSDNIIALSISKSLRGRLFGLG
jgi:Cupin superfamily protein